MIKIKNLTICSLQDYPGTGSPVAIIPYATPFPYGPSAYAWPGMTVLETYSFELCEPKDAIRKLKWEIQ
jgi:hypothetical protein